MIRVIRVIRVPLMRSMLRTPIAELYTQLIPDLKRRWLTAIRVPQCEIPSYIQSIAGSVK
jgi:hypothetical protein